MPFQRCLAAIDADVERILLTGSYLGTSKNSFATVLQAQQHVRIIIEQPALNEGGQVGA